MPLKSVDVAIGMAFLYLLLTFVASAVVELVSNVRNWRAQILHAAIEKMFSGTNLIDVATFYRHALIASLSTNHTELSWVDLLELTGWKPSKETGTPPAYIPAGIFSAVVLERIRHSITNESDLSPDEEIKTVVQWLQDDRPVAKDLSTDSRQHEAPTGSTGASLARDGRHAQSYGLDSKGPSALHSVVETAVATQGYSIQAVKIAIEKWFNDTMERTSGWYKRRTRSLLLILGLIIALGGNVDSIAIAKWLWQGDAARQAVVGVAADYVRNHPTPQAPAPTASTPKGASPPSPILESLKQVAEVDKTIADLGYPIGFGQLLTQFREDEAGFLWFMQYLLGCLISAIAISMGSPFWFDATQSLIKMRGTGPKPGTR